MLARVVVNVFLGRPALALGVLAQLPELVFGVLAFVLGADSGVDSGFHTCIVRRGRTPRLRQGPRRASARVFSGLPMPSTNLRLGLPEYAGRPRGRQAQSDQSETLPPNESWHARQKAQYFRLHRLLPRFGSHTLARIDCCTSGYSLAVASRSDCSTVHPICTI